jgi:hypothetical protein
MPQQRQKLLSEFQAALGKSQTAWSEQAKALAQQNLNAGLWAVQNSTALLFEEAARMNAGTVRKAFEEGVARMEETLAASRRIAWSSLAASVEALTAAICSIFVHMIHRYRASIRCQKPALARIVLSAKSDWDPARTGTRHCPANHIGHTFIRVELPYFSRDA